MAAYILCQVPRTDKPYYIENISRNIYSLEELCYYLYHNLYLIDQSIMNEKLCSWLEKELGLTSLSAKLRPVLGKFADESDFIYPIFKEINYLTYQEMKDLSVSIKTLNEESLFRRRKKKGDALIKNGMYVKAIQVYQDLLKEMKELDELRPETEAEALREREKLLAVTWHNLGCAYANLFQMTKALTCFENEYKTSKTQNSLVSYLSCFQKIRTPLEFESLAAELQISDEVREILRSREEHISRLPEPEVYTRNIDELINRLAKEYHRSTHS